MAQKYYFKTTAGSTLIPIADGTHYTEDMDENYGNGEVYVKVLGADGVTQIAASAGTITFTGSPDGGGQYLAASANGAVDATKLEVAGTTSTYTPPTFSGSVTKGKMVLASLAGTGATYVQAWHVRRP